MRTIYALEKQLLARKKRSGFWKRIFLSWLLPMLFASVFAGCCRRPKIVAVTGCPVKPLEPLQRPIETTDDCPTVACYDAENAVRLALRLERLERKLREYAEQCSAD